MSRVNALTDLLPASPIAKLVSATAGALLLVEPELVYGLAIVIALNALMSVWYSFRVDDQTASVVLYWLVMRVLVYIITLASIVTLSNMVQMDMMRRLAFGAIAGWEVAVTLGLGARLSPRFQPIYKQLMMLVGEYTPLDASTEDVDASIDRDGDHDE